MRTLANMFLAPNLAALLFSPVASQAQRVTVENVNAATQTLAQDEFQLHLEFAIPDFDKAAPEKINIIYAVLAFAEKTLRQGTIALPTNAKPLAE